MLGPAQLGLAASLGAVSLPVRPRPRVAFFSSGDELVPLGQPLPPGGVYESNRHALWALVSSLGCEPVDLGGVRDDPAALEATLRAAMSRADAVITTGGAADGEADYTKRVAASLGEVAFWKLALRPGRPFAFGLLGNMPFFGLPGNPAAAMVAFLLLVRPALRRLMGCASLDLRTVRVRAIEPMSKRLGREEYPRGTLERCADGETGVRFTPAQGTGSMLSLAQADVLVRLPADTAGIAVGDRVDVLLLEGVC
jgi:molybdopterin molybdotransferase